MRRALIATAAVALAPTLAGCGGDEGDEASGPGAVGPARAGSVAPLAQCRDWNEGTVQEKMETISQIRGDATEPAVSDDEAFEVIERTCAQEGSAGFRLYKVYVRAVAFSGYGE